MDGPLFVAQNWMASRFLRHIHILKICQRMHLVPALLRYQECQGAVNQTMSCKNLLELRQKDQEQAQEIEQVGKSLETESNS